jgi:hypothetical protein
VRRVLVLRLSGLAGISAATLYAGTTAFGSVVDATYSQVAQSVSELTAVDVPHRPPFVAMYATSTLLLGVFAIGLRTALGNGRLSTIGVVLVLFNVGAGLAMVIAFPMDQSHAHGHTTTATAVHNVFVSAAALCGLAGASVLGRALGRYLWWRGVWRFSVAIAAVTVPTAFLAVAAMARLDPYMGLWERVPIGLMLLWVLVVGTRLATAPDTAFTRVDRTAPPVLVLTSTGVRAEQRSRHIREVNAA